jgi:hypothetical protein
MTFDLHLQLVVSPPILECYRNNTGKEEGRAIGISLIFLSGFV